MGVEGGFQAVPNRSGGWERHREDTVMNLIQQQGLHVLNVRSK